MCEAAIRILVAGMLLIFALARSPRTDGNPSKSTLTNATRVAPEASTKARADNSPRFSVAGDEGPIPPETGSNGFGVINCTAVPTRSSPRSDDGIQSRMKSENSRILMLYPQSRAIIYGAIRIIGSANPLRNHSRMSTWIRCIWEQEIE